MQLIPVGVLALAAHLALVLGQPMGDVSEANKALPRKVTNEQSDDAIVKAAVEIREYYTPPPLPTHTTSAMTTTSTETSTTESWTTTTSATTTPPPSYGEYGDYGTYGTYEDY
ncbi:hypothetical protein BJX76DRAFT_361386 [Aspergillus varians]